MDLERIILSEGTQSQGSKCYIVALTCGCYLWMFTYKCFVWNGHGNHKISSALFGEALKGTEGIYGAEKDTLIYGEGLK